MGFYLNKQKNMSNRYISLLRKLHYKSASAASCIARKPATNLAFQVNVDRSSVALERSLHSSACLWKKKKRPEVVGVVNKTEATEKKTSAKTTRVKASKQSNEKDFEESLQET